MASDKVDRSMTTPFLLRVFYRTGAFHKSDEFLNPAALPHHLTLYTWPTCTLGELATHLASATSPSLLPEPSVGTRLVFKLVYPDAKAIANANAPAAFIIRDMGSVVLGADLPGVADYDRIMEAEDEEYEYKFSFDDYENGSNEYGQGSGSNIGAIMDGYRDSATDDSKMTLADYKFVIGDYISVAILPPEADGSVQDASNARSGRGSGPGEARALPPARNENGFGGFDGSPLYGGHGGRHNGRRGRGRGGPGFSGINTIPIGEWRRGEQIPEPSRGGRRGRRW